MSMERHCDNDTQIKASIFPVFQIRNAHEQEKHGKALFESSHVHYVSAKRKENK